MGTVNHKNDLNPSLENTQLNGYHIIVIYQRNNIYSLISYL